MIHATPPRGSQQETYGPASEKNIRAILRRELLSNFGFENMWLMADVLIDRFLALVQEADLLTGPLDPFQTVIYGYDRQRQFQFAQHPYQLPLRAARVHLVTPEELGRLREGASLPSLRAEMAVLNANYLKARLGGAFHVPYDRPVMHECVFSDRHLADTGVTTLDVAKRLIDHGYHPPTVYFPLVVHGALMIEPTESESLEGLDRFVETLLAIAREAREDPGTVKAAPHRTRLTRLDETRAARRPVLRWQPPSAS